MANKKGLKKFVRRNVPTKKINVFKRAANKLITKENRQTGKARSLHRKGKQLLANPMVSAKRKREIRKTQKQLVPLKNRKIKRLKR